MQILGNHVLKLENPGSFLFKTLPSGKEYVLPAIKYGSMLMISLVCQIDYYNPNVFLFLMFFCTSLMSLMPIGIGSHYPVFTPSVQVFTAIVILEKILEGNSTLINLYSLNFF